MRLKVLLPLLVFALIAGALYAGLSLRPREIPSALIGKPVPSFELPPVEGRSKGLATADLRTGEPSLVNVFASWCAPCRIEHPVWVELAKSKEVPIHGLNWKDQPQAAARWLETFGDPYTRTGADISGRVAIDWGVYGAPETFVVAGDGTIVCKYISVVTREMLDQKILPMLRDLTRTGTTSRSC